MIHGNGDQTHANTNRYAIQSQKGVVRFRRHQSHRFGRCGSTQTRVRVVFEDAVFVTRTCATDIPRANVTDGVSGGELITWSCDI